VIALRMIIWVVGVLEEIRFVKCSFYHLSTLVVA
jgi:hypothetical protein